MRVKGDFLQCHQNCCSEGAFFGCYYFKGIFRTVLCPSLLKEWQVWSSERQICREKEGQFLTEPQGDCTGLEKLEMSEWDPNKLMSNAL